MKPFILSLAAVFIFCSSYAQHFEVGVNGGVAFNQPMQYSKYVTPWEGKHLKYSKDESIRLVYSSKKWQYGLSVDEMKASYRIGYIYGDLYLAAGATQLPPSTITYLIGSEYKYYPVKLFVNRKVVIGKFELYGGLSCGYVFFPSLKKEQGLIPPSFSDRAGARNPFNKDGFWGLSAGAQVGGTYFITKHIGVNIEAAADYINFRTGDYTSHLLTVPVTAGVRFRL